MTIITGQLTDDQWLVLVVSGLEWPTGAADNGYDVLWQFDGFYGTIWAGYVRDCVMVLGRRMGEEVVD